MAITTGSSARSQLRVDRARMDATPCRIGEPQQYRCKSPGCFYASNVAPLQHLDVEIADACRIVMSYYVFNIYVSVYLHMDNYTKRAIHKYLTPNKLSLFHNVLL